MLEVIMGWNDISGLWQRICNVCRGVKVFSWFAGQTPEEVIRRSLRAKQDEQGA